METQPVESISNSVLRRGTVNGSKEKLRASQASQASQASLDFYLKFNFIVHDVISKIMNTKIINNRFSKILSNRFSSGLASERGDVPGWVLVVLMTTGLVTAIWTIAAPRLTSILKNSLDAMNGIR